MELGFRKTVTEVKSVVALSRCGISSNGTPILFHKIANQPKGVKMRIAQSTIITLCKYGISMYAAKTWEN